MTKMIGPLSGVKVLDLTRIAAGPFCTMLLADLGADVVKVERPDGGDETRRWVPPQVAGAALSCYFAALNRNKRSVCLDYQTPGGREALLRLAERSDVLIENYLPGALARHGLGYEAVAGRNPGLVYCSVTGFGPAGPYSQRPGYDVIAASVGGLVHITGPSDGAPAKPGVALTDLATGLYAHGAILSALYERQSTQKGRKIDVDLLSTQLSLLINIGSNFLNAGQEGQRWGTAHASLVPYQSFATKNGYLTVGAGSDQQYAVLCERIQAQHLARDARYASNALRVQNRQELVGKLAEIFAQKTTEEWLQRFEGARLPYGPVNTIGQAFADEHVAQSGLVQEIAGVRMVGPAVLYDGQRSAVRLPPPELGQHTRQVLVEELGYTESQFEALVEEGAAR